MFVILFNNLNMFILYFCNTCLIIFEHRKLGMIKKELETKGGLRVQLLGNI